MKKTQNKPFAKVCHFDLYGKREEKYNFLKENSVDSIDWKELENKEPYFFFVPKNFEEDDNYKEGFKIDNLFSINNSGVSTDRDTLFLDDDDLKLSDRIIKLLSGAVSEDFIQKYNVKDSSGYPITKRILNKEFDKNNILKYHYRPFDIKYIYFDNRIISRSANKVSINVINKNNFILIVPRQVNTDFHHTFISSIISDSNITSSARLFGAGKLFPLYLYSDKEENGIFTEKDISTSSAQGRKPNLNNEIVEQIAEKLGLEFVPEKDLTGFQNLSGLAKNFAPIDILDYIYAVLHSPTYREKYKEFLKIDFPRVPYPKDVETFWQLVKLGGDIRQIHLLEEPAIEKSKDAQPCVSTYPIDGDNIITTKIGKKDWEIVKTHGRASQALGRIWINETQYFENIPLIAWEFYIGGYQPAQKWLKDRKGRTLNFEDILHYQKIIVALTETDRLMKEIDKIEIE